MLAMPDVRGVANGRMLSAGAALVFGAGLALYQLTSLVLGPVGSRQLDLSLAIPAIELQDVSDPNASTVKLVVGMPATPDASAPRATRVAFSPNAAASPTPKASSHALPLPVPSPVVGEGQGGGSHPSGKKLPVNA
jgi:hypothetical protein